MTAVMVDALPDVWAAEMHDAMATVPFTPCSPRHGKYCSREHAAMVNDYRDARAVYVELVEQRSMGYDTDRARIISDDHFSGECVTFGKWLYSNRKPREIEDDMIDDSPTATDMAAAAAAAKRSAASVKAAVTRKANRGAREAASAPPAALLVAASVAWQEYGRALCGIVGDVDPVTSLRARHALTEAVSAALVAGHDRVSLADALGVL